MMLSDLYYASSGPPGAPVLLLLHPLGADHEFWDDCVRIWSTRFRVVACDLRGAGRSEIPDRLWRVADHVRDLIAIRERLDLREVVPIGCAIGSLIATAYAAADQQHIRALVLSSTAPRLGLESKQRTEARVELVRQRGMDALLPDVIDLAFEKQPRDARYQLYMERFRKNDPRGYASLALGMVGTDNSAALPTITCPSLVLVGRHDVLLPPNLSRAVHDMLAGSEFQIIEPAAHFPPYQAPDLFAGIVSDFLERKLLSTR